MKKLGLFLLIAILSTAANSQKADSVLNDCTRVESESKDFSVCLPLNGYMILREGDFRRIFYGSDGVFLTVMMNRGDDAKTRFRMPGQVSNPAGEQTFVSGDFLIRQRSSNSPEFVDRSLDFASSTGFYSISLKVRPSAVSYLDRFLTAILLEGKPMFTAKVTPFDEKGQINVSTLQTSPEIAEALKRPNSAEKKLVSASKDDLVVDDEGRLSRRVIILVNPFAPYTDAARSAKASGTVKLRVTFLANGTVGPIKLVESVHPELDRNSFESAKKIKFLPAEVAGKPVDFSRIMQYSFTIY